MQKITKIIQAGLKISNQLANRARRQNQAASNFVSSHSSLFSWSSLILILFLGLFVRLYKIDNPIADWHSWRQADTASVSRVFIQEGVNLLVPRFQDISPVTTGQFNPQGYRMVELPIYNLLHTLNYYLQPDLGIDQTGRLTSVYISLFSLLLLYLIVRRLSGKLTALLAALLMALLPFNIYYSRVVLPEPAMIGLFLASFYFFLKFLDSDSKSLPFFNKSSSSTQKLYYLFSALFLALAILVKPYAAFFTLPYLYLAYLKLGSKPKALLRSPYFYLFAGLVILPFVAWRIWILQFPEGIPGASWLFNFDGIRLRPAWFRWLFGVRLGHLILGYWGILPLGLGLLLKPSKKEAWTYHLWFVGILAYFIVIAGGNVTHDYYQAITIPFIVVLLAKGGVALLNFSEKIFVRPVAWTLFVLCFGLALSLSWYEIRSYYQINNPAIIEAGQAVDRLVPKDALVVAPYNGDTAFLYQTNRFGWTVVSPDIMTMVDPLGANYYVSVNYDADTSRVLEIGGYEIIEQNPRYIIVKLRYP